MSEVGRDEDSPEALRLKPTLYELRSRGGGSAVQVKVVTRSLNTLPDHLSRVLKYGPLGYIGYRRGI